MAESSRETLVLDAVVTLVDSVMHDFDVVELLLELTGQCAELLDVASAGLLLAGARGQLQVMAATSDRTVELESFQVQIDEGPCRDCFTVGEPVSVADLSSVAERWPRFARAAGAAGFASVHAVPLRAAGTVLGALGLFGTTTGELNEADRLVAWSLAHIASVAILQAKAPAADVVLPRVRSALSGRVVVEQACGFVRERLGVTIGEALRLLRRCASVRGTHLTVLCRQLIKQPDARPELLAALRELTGSTAPGGPSPAYAT